MKLQVIETTDDQHLGMVFDVPTPMLDGVTIPVSGDVTFSIQKSEILPDNKYRYSNANYVAVVRVV